MTVFFDESKTVDVSRISQDGWWIENTTEHVAKGTALGDDFTQNIYTPSADGLIARYDRETDTWSDEIEDMSSKKFYSIYGQPFVIGVPDGDFPEGAITEAPPEYDREKQTVLYKDDEWKVYPIRIGELYFNEYGQEYIVSDYNFDLPDGYTFTPPPKIISANHAVKWIENSWEELPDYRGQFAFAKDRADGENYHIKELGDIPETHTLIEPKLFESWVNDGWHYDVDRHRPVKAIEEKSWRDAELVKVLDRIDQYEKDQSYPVELRTSPIQNEDDYMKLLQDRKTLSDYPETENFPFGTRPTLSGVIA
ncbi:hypothetical protein [Vibrio diazotrophicus]|uniref:hypothetical protein n=1 Tax=Vibrio diazotrophicus TaxID=685 RepID=UPI000C9E16E9|nr:hypothetical protein [Vibrio diazotrophicus]PNH88146.1 hypothetical protein C1M59_20505 [Vibrio diazotrophicus]